MKSLAPTLAFALVCAAAQAAQAAPQVAGPWSRPAAAGTTGAGFMLLTNPGKAAEILVAVESPLARRVEIHRTTMRDGVSSMQRVDRVVLPPGGSTTFAPGGQHLMFFGLSKALKTGDVLPATLVFASGVRVKAEFKVGVTAPAEGHAHH